LPSSDMSHAHLAALLSEPFGCLQSPHEEGSTGDDPRMGYLLIMNKSSFLPIPIRYRGGELPLARCHNRRDHAQRHGVNLVWRRRFRCGGLGFRGLDPIHTARQAWIRWCLAVGEGRRGGGGGGARHEEQVPVFWG
jgi:hypothetical protein